MLVLDDDVPSAGLCSPKRRPFVDTDLVVNFKLAVRPAPSMAINYGLPPLYARLLLVAVTMNSGFAAGTTAESLIEIPVYAVSARHALSGSIADSHSNDEQSTEGNSEPRRISARTLSLLACLRPSLGDEGASEPHIKTFTSWITVSVMIS